MTGRREVVVFDLDGTLVDSSASMRVAFEAAFARVSAGPAPFDELEARQGRPFADICRELGWPAGLAEAFTAESRARAHQVRLFPGVEAVLRGLAAGGTRLALLTGKDRLRTEELLDLLGLSQLFRWLVCGDDPLPGKPSPDGLAHLMAVGGSEPPRTLYVGDSPVDHLCAQAVEVDFLGVEWPGQPVQLSPAAGLDIVREASGLARALHLEAPCAPSC